MLKVAVASDLHVFSTLEKDATRPSHLRTTDKTAIPTQHPISGLKELIKRENLRAGIFVCPGDLGHQADPEGIRYAWDVLQQLKSDLNADHLLVVTGNHDMDSRLKFSTYDPEATLKDLEPTYPFADLALTNQYWARAFAIVELSNCRCVLLNSSAYHRGSDIEKNYGRVDPSTLAGIERALRNGPPSAVNLLVCHHHPQQHSEHQLGEQDFMREGQVLLEMLGAGDLGRWLVIHGHKHHPKLSYAAGSSTSAVVFSAGSLSVEIYPKLGTAARNQFYVLELNEADIKKYGMVGTGKAWDWIDSVGWKPAGVDSGLPATFGFGFRQDPLITASTIATIVGEDVKQWSEVLSSDPTLQYLSPKDLNTVLNNLKVDYGFEVTHDKFGAPAEIGKHL